VLVAALPLAAAAHAAWGSSATGGPLAVTSGVLNAPDNVAVNVGTCVAKASVDVIVSWDATTPVAADGYQVYRATSKTGRYTLLATVPGAGTSYDDTSTGFSSTYFYEIEATRDAWTSPTTVPVKIRTPSKKCG
jgi:hypothetical protein